jgi:exonuclease III
MRRRKRLTIGEGLPSPLWVRAQTWFQLGRVPRRALKPLLGAGYVDCFREMHPQEDGFTFPSTGPRVRLDYVFAAPPLAGALSGCRWSRSPLYRLRPPTTCR